MVGPAHASAVISFAALAMTITGMQALAPSSAAAKILLFEDVTSTSGIDLKGVTHSVVWGDYNNDGCPDLWISKHSGDDGQAANFYRNLCNGHFVDVTKATVGDLRGNLDFHGPAWADFDNDGDVDLMQLRGGGEGVGRRPEPSSPPFRELRRQTGRSRRGIRRRLSSGTGQNAALAGLRQRWKTRPVLRGRSPPRRKIAADDLSPGRSCLRERALGNRLRPGHLPICSDFQPEQRQENGIRHNFRRGSLGRTDS